MDAAVLGYLSIGKQRKYCGNRRKIAQFLIMTFDYHLLVIDFNITSLSCLVDWTLIQRSHFLLVLHRRKWKQILNLIPHVR
jgi:hypothetical protein